MNQGNFKSRIAHRWKLRVSLFAVLYHSNFKTCMVDRELMVEQEFLGVDDRPDHVLQVLEQGLVLT